MSNKLVVDVDLCIGCGACAQNHPDFFKMNDSNRSKVIAPYDETRKDEIDDAVNSCPAGAIKIEEEEKK
jgi:ferredoxin